MTTLTLAQFERIPSIGALLGTQGHREVLDQINNELGSASFFGSNDDPFASQHNFFIKRVVEPIRLVAKQFKTQMKGLLSKDDNVYRPIISLDDLEQGIPECMWVPIAMHPLMRKWGEQHRVDLFGMDTKNFPEENPYQRLMDNGRVTLTAEELIKNKGKYEVEYEWRSDDPQLTDDEIEDLRDTYDFISLFYNDLDNMYAKMDKLHILKEKPYMTEGTLLQDLDITSFPDKKG